MNRRIFLQNVIAIPAAAWLASLPMPSRGQETKGSSAMDKVNTVSGPITVDKLGVTLPHEHILVDFIGAAEVSPDRYDADEVVNTVLPYLVQAREVGVQTLVECTPAYLARDAVVLAKLSELSGVQIVTNTGYYGAGQDKFLPPHAFTESADELAARWMREAQDGIDGTGILPGFIKTAVDPGPLSEVDRKLLHAAAITHRETGLVIASHTTDAVSILETLEILQEESVPGDGFIWVHAHTVTDLSVHDSAAEAGIWIELDGLSKASVDLHLELLTHHHKKERLNQIMISHDAGWYSVGEPGGGDFRGFDTLFNEMNLAMIDAGVGKDEWEQLVIRNPAQAFRIR